MANPHGFPDDDYWERAAVQQRAVFKREKLKQVVILAFSHVLVGVIGAALVRFL